jgi:hypothetical protein
MSVSFDVQALGGNTLSNCLCCRTREDVMCMCVCLCAFVCGCIWRQLEQFCVFVCVSVCGRCISITDPLSTFTYMYSVCICGKVEEESEELQYGL